MAIGHLRGWIGGESGRRAAPPIPRLAFHGTLLFLAWVSVTHAQIELVADRPVQQVFGGGPRVVAAQFRNRADRTVTEDIQVRLYQASASTLAPLEAAKSWKKLALLPGQTSLESIEVTIPVLRSETALQLVVLGDGRKLGAIHLRAYPGELLKPLAVLAGDVPLGLLDPEGQLKPAFGSVPTTALTETGELIATESKLVIIAPMSRHSRPAGLAAAVKRKAAAGAAVVWIQPSAPRALEPWPEVYILSESGGHVAIAEASTITDFTNSPRAQLNLLRLAELAVGHQKLGWPADPNP